MFASDTPKTEYTILRDGQVAHQFTGPAEAMAAHIRSLQRRFPNSYWDVERAS